MLVTLHLNRELDPQVVSPLHVTSAHMELWAGTFSPGLWMAEAKHMLLVHQLRVQELHRSLNQGAETAKAQQNFQSPWVTFTRSALCYQHYHSCSGWGTAQQCCEMVSPSGDTMTLAWKNTSILHAVWSSFRG